jgi:phosphoserine phosphatase
MGLIAVFDFDGTLIKEDSMVLLFRRYYKSSWGNIGAKACPGNNKILYENKFPETI